MLTIKRAASAALLSLFAIAFVAIDAEARSRGGGGFGGGGVRAGGFGGGGAMRGLGGGAFRAGGFGGRAAMIGGGRGLRSAHVGRGSSRAASYRGSPMIGRSARMTRSFSGLRSGQSIRSGFVRRQKLVAGGRSNRQLAGGNTISRRGAAGPGGARASVLRNNAFASASTRGVKGAALAKATFNGQFAGKNHLAGKKWHSQGGWHWRHHHKHPIIVIGWIGPLFWPYAYWDFIDYTFWPYAYDAFWPYAYDDIYVGVFGPYAYEGSAHAPRRVVARSARRPSTTTAVVCHEQAPALTNWPIQQITETVQPDETQRAALNELKTATAEAVKVLQSACPDELPSTPIGRLEAMHKRTATMLQALNIVQPPLQAFYDSLNDEQKSRFNVVSRDAETQHAAGGKSRSAALSQPCDERAVAVTSAPIERIARTLNPDDGQRLALDALKNTTTDAAAFLNANCPTEQTLTPPGRVAAMQQRLKATLEAITMVQPALKNFYGLLTDEQKARFNQIAAERS